MQDNPLEIRLEALEGRTGHYTLSFNPSQYSLSFNPEANVAFSTWLRHLPSALVGRTDPGEPLAPEQLLQEVGTWLWRALFPATAPKEERETLAQALRTGSSPLLLTLPDALSVLPWELLYDPEQPDGLGFLARRRPLMRLAAVPPSVASIAPPLRVLLLISSPVDLREESRVDVESERAAVEYATRDMREAGLLHLLVEDLVSPQRVQQALVRFKPHILHYIGHGGYDKESGGMLFWEDDHEGETLAVSATKLAELLRPRKLAAVVLHACQTGRGDARTGVLSLAQTLVRAGLPAVIAQQANLSYASSQQASQAWYTALTAAEGLAQALFEVRLTLAQTENPDWAVPFLFGGIACLSPLIDATAPAGPIDPLLTSQSVIADLPTPTGIFVGRHTEMRALRMMLEQAPGNRASMALITGPGGIGKSTLAAQAALRYGGKYKAVLTLSCLGYQRVEPFLQRIGEVLSQNGHPGFLEQSLPDPKKSTAAKIEEAVSACNRAGPFLFLIDNLESVQQEDRALRDQELLFLLQKLLTNLRGGRVLITSRYAVKDLLPQGKFAAHLSRLDLDDLSRYETSQLLTSHPTLAKLGEMVRAKLIDEFGGLPYVYDLLSSDAASQSLDQLIHDVQMRLTQERKQRAKEEWEAIRHQVVEFVALEETTKRLLERSLKLLGQLSVLELPFPLQALEQGLGVAREAWQPLLDWSLLRFDAQTGLYRLHSLTRRHAHRLLEESMRQQTQRQLALWYERYATQESHALQDYLEAHRLLRAAGNFKTAGEFVLQLAGTLRRYGWYPLLRELCQSTFTDLHGTDELLALRAQHELGMIAQDQGNYEEARHLYQESLAIAERLGDQSGRASSLHQLGSIAQAQGNYEEARHLYQESLAIAERLGNQSGRASSLGQLGILAYEQHDFEQALKCSIQAWTLFQVLGSPSCEIVQRLITRIQRQMDEANFKMLWETAAGSLPLPAFPDEDTSQMIQTIIDFIQASTWDESKQFLKIHPELLRPEVDALLQDLAARQEHEKGRNAIEEHRLLLSRCREVGIEAAFSEREQSSQVQQSFVDEINRICNEVAALLRAGQMEQQQAFATHLEQRFADTPLSEEIQSFLQLLIAWLRGQERETFKALLQSPFQDAYTQMVALVEQQGVEEGDESDAGEEEGLTLDELPEFVAALVMQGTQEQRERFASWLLQSQQQFPSEELQLRQFFGCLIAVLRGEEPDLTGLQAPFTDLWQELRQRLATSAEQESQQEESSDE